MSFRTILIRIYSAETFFIRFRANVEIYCKEYVECAVEGLKQFLSGKTVEESKSAMEEKYKENHYKIGGLIGALLLENKDNMVVVGDPNLTMYDIPNI